MEKINLTNIKRELMIDAKAIGIPKGAAEIFIDRAMKDATKKLENHHTKTPVNFDHALYQELKQYHKDLAYVYEIRDKII